MIKFKTIDLNSKYNEYKSTEDNDIKRIIMGYNTQVPGKPFIILYDPKLHEVDMLEEFLNNGPKRTFNENLYFASEGYQPQLAIKNFKRFQNGKEHFMSHLLSESNGFFMYHHQVEHFYNFLNSYPNDLINEKVKFRREMNKKKNMQEYSYTCVKSVQLSKYIKRHSFSGLTSYARIRGAYRLQGINI